MDKHKQKMEIEDQVMVAIRADSAGHKQEVESEDQEVDGIDGMIHYCRRRA